MLDDVREMPFTEYGIVLLPGVTGLGAVGAPDGAGPGYAMLAMRCEYG